MSNVKHTQGPWYFKAEHDSMTFGEEKGAEIIHACSCCGGINFRAVGGEAQANGRLIVASPELFEIVERYSVPLINHNFSVYPDMWEKALEKTMTVLNKINGVA